MLIGEVKSRYYLFSDDRGDVFSLIIKYVRFPLFVYIWPLLGGGSFFLFLPLSVFNHEMVSSMFTFLYMN